MKQNAQVLKNPDPATRYAFSVAEGKIETCRYVRLACERHLRDLEREDVWYDREAAKRFSLYCRLLKHYKGDYAGRPIELELWQHFAFGNVYGWNLVNDAGDPTSLWRFNIIYIEIPRKNGKTTICAAGASYDCVLVEPTGAEIYCLATKEDQAKLIYNDVAAYIAQSPDLGDVFEILQGRNTIYSIEAHRTSFIKPMGADSKRHDGLNPLGTYADELHAWPKRDLWDVFRNAVGARKRWHMVAITTAGHDRLGICWEQREHLINLLEGRFTADNKFGVIYTVEEGKEENWQDEKQWFIANPNLGHGKELTEMRAMAREAEQMPSALNQFLNKQLNIWTDTAEAWIRGSAWRAIKAKFGWEQLKGKRCYAGLDLAEVNDLSAVVYTFPRQPGVDKVRYLVDYYLPQTAIRLKSEKDGVDYQQWADAGWITLTPGDTTDFNFIQADIIKRRQMAHIISLGYDRFFASMLITNLRAEGIICDPVGMGFVSMHAPSSEFERLVVAKESEHNGNPIFEWNISNTVIKRDPAGNIKPDKELSVRRIDGAVAAIISLAKMVNEAKGPSVYEKRGLLVL